jgi:hypothetical protein
MSFSQSYYQNVGPISSTGQPRYPPHLISVVGNQQPTHFVNSQYPIHSGNTQYPVHSGNTQYPVHSGNTQYPVHSGNTQYPVHSSHVVDGIYPPHLQKWFQNKASGPILQQDIVMTSNGPMVRTIRRQF